MRTPETEANYRSRYRSLRRRVAKHLGCNPREEVSVADVSRWLASFVARISHATYRQYRAAIHQELRDLCDARAISRAEVEMLASEMLVVRGEDGASPYAPLRPCRTSAGRAKGLAETTSAKLIDKAAEHGPTGEDLADYLTFGPKLGLRLCEWTNARLEGAVLTVPCGKYSIPNGRGIAAHRTQLLRLDEHELARLDRFLKRLNSEIQSVGGREDLILRRLGRLLRQIRRHAGARRVTLRTARHQFTANLRAAGYSREERAAALGHAAADTSDQHYGKRNRGWRTLGRWFEVPERLMASVRPGAKTKAKLNNGGALTRSEIQDCGQRPSICGPSI
jgi:hypothetical protein